MLLPMWYTMNGRAAPESNEIKWMTDGMNYRGQSADGSAWRATYRCLDNLTGKPCFWFTRDLQEVVYFGNGLPARTTDVHKAYHSDY